MPNREALRAFLPVFGRFVVATGAITAIGFFIQQLATGTSFYSAFIKGVVAGVVLMFLLGIAQRFWEGDKLKDAQFPGGAGGGFEDAAEETVEVLKERVSKQMDELNKRFLDNERRLYDLEGAAFKDPAAGDDPPE